MKVDLDELERKARDAASPGAWRSGADDGMTGMSILRDDANGDVWQVADRCSPEDAQHIAANSPPVTLALVARIRELEALTTAQQLVIDAADNLTRVKREAEKVFRTGLAGMPDLVRTSPIAKGLADATSKAGMKLERVLDAHRARFP